MFRNRHLVGALILAGALAGCDSAGPASQQPAVQLSIATRPASAAPAPGGPQFVGGPVEYTDGTNTLVIDSVFMVVKEVELKRSEASTDCSHDGSSDDSSSHNGMSGDDDSCEELETGPYLLDLPLSGGATSVITVDVVPGTYDEFEFKIHKPEDDDSNAAFLAQHPEYEGVSIRVVGTWNGAPFTYETDLDAEQEMDLIPPLVVGDAGTVDLTLFIDIGTWFRFPDSSLINPSTANKGGANESTVEQNIENSFQSFEDEDHNGHDDHGDD